MPPTPMFPLGMVLLPGASIPLHVFEPRFLALLEIVLAGDREFGVVLIERGHEVGGGDVRTSVGTMARVVDAQLVGPDRWALLATGVRRIRVNRWLPDDPYPVAEVQDWPDDEAPMPSEAASLVSELRELVVASRGLAARLQGAPDPDPVDLGSDLGALSFRAAIAAPLGPLDRLAVLEAAGPADRLSLVHQVVSDQIELLHARLDLDPT